MTRRAGMVAAVTVGVTLLGAGGVAANGGGKDPGTITGGPGPTLIPPGVRGGPPGARRDVTQPGEYVVNQVWRNGRFWPVRVRIRREDITMADGTTGQAITEVPGEAERVNREELPPRDPSFDHVRPTPEQVAAVKGDDCDPVKGCRIPMP